MVLTLKRGSDDPIFILEAMFGDHDPYTTKASPTYVYVRQTAQVAASISDDKIDPKHAVVD